MSLPVLTCAAWPNRVYLARSLETGDEAVILTGARPPTARCKVCGSERSDLVASPSGGHRCKFPWQCTRRLRERGAA